MDQIVGKVGTYWVNRQATQELSSVTGEGNSISNGIEGAKWLVNKVKGKMQKPLAEVLKEFDLPLGLFPEEVTHYEFNEGTKRLEVFVPKRCDVVYSDASVVRFSTSVAGYLEKGKMTDVEGMKTKVLIWVKVTCIATEATKIHFSAGLKRTRDRSAYEVAIAGVPVA